MKKILVTGATGKSGQYFLKEVAANFEQIKGEYSFGFIVRDNGKIALVTKHVPKCNIHIGTLEDEKFVEDVFIEGEYDTVLHISGINHSLNIVKAAVKSRINWIICVHTTGIFSKYKAAGELYREIEKEINDIICDKDVSLTILRPTMIYGNLQDNNVAVFIKMVDKLRVFPTVSGGKYELQPVWCGDLGKAYYQVLLKSETTMDKQYNLSGRHPIKLIDMFRIMAKELGVTNKFFSVPFWMAYFGAWIIYLLTLGKKDFREKVQRLVEDRVYDHEQAKKDFGYSPVSFEEGVKRQIQEYKSINR